VGMRMWYKEEKANAPSKTKETDFERLPND
jgi:hypothetical protein